MVRLAADAAVLGSLYPDEAPEEIDAGLKTLTATYVIIYKNYHRAWSVSKAATSILRSN